MKKIEAIIKPFKLDDVKTRSTKSRQPHHRSPRSRVGARRPHRALPRADM